MAEDGDFFYPHHQMKYWVLIKKLWGGQDRESQKMRDLFKKQSVSFHAVEKNKVSQRQKDLQLDLWWSTLR